MWRLLNRLLGRDTPPAPHGTPLVLRRHPEGRRGRQYLLNHMPRPDVLSNKRRVREVPDDAGR